MFIRYMGYRFVVLKIIKPITANINHNMLFKSFKSCKIYYKLFNDRKYSMDIAL